ncbi:hypothetical protein [Halodesulfovibrio aestuarii]|uniref:Uncharacterized protein n=1 Tax=Halodesulfovibrio aestuarii TaxID=126333 RepID=A0ABV4JVP8_9BACT
MEKCKHLISGLVRDKQERLTKVAQLESELQKIQAQLDVEYKHIEAIDLLLQSYDPSFKTENVKKKATRKHIFARGELKKLVLRLLKNKGRVSTTTIEITDYVFSIKGQHNLNKDNYKNVERQLRNYEEVVSTGKDDNNVTLWILKRYAAEENESENRAVVTRLRAPQ